MNNNSPVIMETNDFLFENGPFCERKPLFELQGKTVAVDLSCWICEAQNIAEYQVQPRMYLRNLYFRTCYLLLMDVNPVFVLEGKAPELKYDTIASRNAIQFKGAKPKKDGVKTGKDRSRFHFVLKQCEEMLRYMGLACIKGNGEAESLCAYLNEDGLVDGCISQDSDCFAYGAQVVYRNFSISTQGTHAASGGAVDIYDIKKANKSLNFGRNKIVAMALLIGCDYCDGVQGVGKDSVLKFFETVTDLEVLDRIRSWRSEESTYAGYEKKLNDKNICSSCGHFGKIQSHTKKGCTSCKTSAGCDPFKYKEERLKIKNEVSIRNKAIVNRNFPDETLIEEFLKRKDNVCHLNLEWKQPNLVQFVKFTGKFLQWEELYTFEKILPILTRWQCKNPDKLGDSKLLKGTLTPQRIKKVRSPKGVPSYEIIWADPDGCFEGLIPEDQLDGVDLEKLWSTIEPQRLVQHAYPDLVENFLQSKIKPKKPSKRKKNADLKNLSISEPVTKKTRKPRITKKKKDICALENEEFDDLESSLRRLSLEKPITKPLDSCLRRALLQARAKNNQNYGCLQEMNMSTPAKGSTSNPFDLDMSVFGDEEDLDVSEIVNNIVSRKVLKFDEIVEDLDNVECFEVIQNKFDLNCGNIEVLSSEDEDENMAVENCDENRLNSSSFFISNAVEENDLFERTLNEMCNKESSGDETEEYEVDENEILCGVFDDKGSENNIEDISQGCSKENEDSFSVEYVPLCDRLKRQQCS